MTTAYTSLLGLALPVQGELTGAWGDVVNTSITELLDTAVAGTTTLSTDADVTLTTTTGAANQARQAILNCTGARTAIRTITAPATSKMYVVVNGTSGGYAVKLIGSGPTTGVSVPAGSAVLVIWNGSDFQYVASTTISTLTVTGALTVNGNAALGDSASGDTHTVLGRVNVTSSNATRAFSITNSNASSASGLSINSTITDPSQGIANNFCSDSTTTAYGIVNFPDVVVGVTNYHSFRSALYTAASAALTEYIHYYASFGANGAGATITNLYGFYCSSGLTTGTNNYAFRGNVAAGTNRYNLYMSGSAANYFQGDMQFNKTVTAAGTTGAQTISKNAGTVNFAAGATSLVVTNTLVTTSSIIVATVGTNDTTMKSVSAVAAAGSFTLFASAAPTAETRVNFIVIN